MAAAAAGGSSARAPLTRARHRHRRGRCCASCASAASARRTRWTTPSPRPRPRLGGARARPHRRCPCSHPRLPMPARVHAPTPPFGRRGLGLALAALARAAETQAFLGPSPGLAGCPSQRAGSRLAIASRTRRLRRLLLAPGAREAAVFPASSLNRELALMRLCGLVPLSKVCHVRTASALARLAPPLRPRLSRWLRRRRSKPYTLHPSL